MDGEDYRMLEQSVDEIVLAIREGAQLIAAAIDRFTETINNRRPSP